MFELEEWEVIKRLITERLLQIIPFGIIRGMNNFKYINSLAW